MLWQPLQPRLTNSAAPVPVSAAAGAGEAGPDPGGDEVTAGGAVATGAADGAATPSSPFIPFAACPGVLDRYSYVPPFASTTLSVAVFPGLIGGVDTPAQAFRPALVRGAEQTLNACASA